MLNVDSRNDHVALRDTATLMRKGLFAALAFSSATNLLMLVVPIFALQIYDRVLTSRSVDTLIVLTAIAVTALVTVALLECARGLLISRLLGRVQLQLSRPLFAGQLAARNSAQSDGFRGLAAVKSFAGGPGLTALMDLVWTPIFLAAVFFIHPLLGSALLAGMLMIMCSAPLSAWIAGRSERQARAAQGRAEAYQGLGRRVPGAIDALGSPEGMIQRWRYSLTVSVAEQTKVDGTRTAVTSARRFVRLVLQIGIIALGAHLTIGGFMTPGGIIAASILASRALAPIDVTISSWGSLIAAVRGQRELKAALQALPDVADENAPDIELPAPKGDLRVERATVFKEASEAILRDVNLHVEPGQILTISGGASAGKSTLACVIAGLVEPRLGGARLDEIELSSWSWRQRGQYVGYLSQHPTLLPGQVRENISGFEEHANGDSAAETDASIIAAAKLVGAHEIILRLPQGYETEVGPDRHMLSGNELQRIALARAVFGDRRLVVLDEPSGNLDGHGEACLVDALDRLKAAGVTVVMVTNRTSLIGKSDLLLVLAGGRVRHFGPCPDQARKMIRPVSDRRESGPVFQGATYA